MKISLNLMRQLAKLHIIEAEKRTQCCRQQVNAVIVVFHVCGANIFRANIKNAG